MINLPATVLLPLGSAKSVQFLGDLPVPFRPVTPFWYYIGLPVTFTFFGVRIFR